MQHNEKTYTNDDQINKQQNTIVHAEFPGEK